jgi:Zn-dependent protease with chaperone function
MSEMTATRKWPAWGAATIAVAAVVVWLIAAYLLLRTTVPGGLHLSGLDQHRFFSASELARTARYERFVRIVVVLSLVAEIVALFVLTKRAPRIARNTGLGPIGAGMIIAMITLAVLWAVDLPFSTALRWWDQRHDLTQGSWFDWLVAPWAQLAGGVAFVMVQVAVVMYFARRSPRNWWLPVTPLFLLLAAVFLATFPYLDAGRIHPPQTSQLKQDVKTLQRAEGINTPVDIEKVSDLTTQANAFSVGLGPTERVVVWDTLLDGRFSDAEVRVVLAHEFGHIAHHHLWKGLAWAALFTFPIAFGVARITARRGGLGDPGLLPYGALVLVLLNIAIQPLTNVVSRRYEAEADWSALRAAKSPAAQKKLMEQFAETSLQQPNPPTWSYVFFDTHPTLMQRIAMAQAWQDREQPPSPHG